ncbi:MAG: hydantoinase B/oxoprolinase family protein [Alphaproteobacteria bacterium]
MSDQDKAGADKGKTGGYQVDPIRYEMFVHRLVNITEEGRIALQKVCASPIVVQGGECMCSFSAPDGTTIISASGHLRFSAGCEDAVKKVIEYYSENPGINDGDQFFMNDPYIASTHVYDEMLVKPIYHGGKLIAWCSAMTHTSDTGGILRGGATEIFHEGVRSCGIKLVENGKIRLDVFKNLTEQCRDPEYVGLDLKSRIAANNVCARGFLQLIEKYGAEFVQTACRKLHEDSESMARARLTSLPDGTWRATNFGCSTDLKTGGAKVFQVVCTMTKQGDEITFDYTGTSPQSDDANNSTYVGTWGQLFVALTSQLFWNITWNGGMTKPVTMTIPEGTLNNCRYPAACGGAPGVGNFTTQTASACIAKMLYAAGLDHDVNASLYGAGSGGGGSNSGGIGAMYGGHNQHGLPVGQGLYDRHAHGFGAAPYRDGVSTAGHMNNPTVGISDIENIELQYPLLYLSRNHMTDSGGFGKYRGGLGLQRIIMAYGTDDLTVNYSPYHGIPGGWGMFGGYPMGIGGNKYLLDADNIKDELAKSRYPVTHDDFAAMGEAVTPDLAALKRLSVPEGGLMFDPVGVGSGYGDPIDRDPEKVLQDVKDQAVSAKFADKIYGVVFANGGTSVDEKATETCRAGIRALRLAAAEPVGPRGKTTNQAPEPGETLVRIHEYIHVVRHGTDAPVCECRKCHHNFGPATENYKLGSVRIVVDKDELTEMPLPAGKKSLALFANYYCPGCATALDVEAHCPALEGDKIEPIWDIQPDMKSLEKTATAPGRHHRAQAAE